jgi:hypothetical protein
MAGEDRKRCRKRRSKGILGQGKSKLEMSQILTQEEGFGVKERAKKKFANPKGIGAIEALQNGKKDRGREEGSVGLSSAEEI